MLAAAAALAATGAFWLQNTGTTTLAIQVPPGLSADGKIADVVPLTPTPIQRPEGNAQIQAGVALARIDVAQGYSTSVALDLAWINPLDAGQVLNNPNAQVHVGVYYPIYEGTCSSGAANSLDDVRASVTDSSLPGSVKTHCLALDENATGTIIQAGKLALHRTNVAGYVKVARSDATIVDCEGQTDANTTWCRTRGFDADRNALYVAATIITPGGKPAGQQNNVSALEFYLGVRRQ